MYGHITDGGYNQYLECKLLSTKTILTFAIISQSEIPLLPSQVSLEWTSKD